MTVKIDLNRCKGCNYCRVAIACPSEDQCTNCQACIDACPSSARTSIQESPKLTQITCYINGYREQLKNRQTVLQALQFTGYKISYTFPSKNSLFTPCRTGGCYSCAVLVDNELRQACITPIRDGMKIETDVSNRNPLRIISGFQGHFVGGVGTPKYIMPSSHSGYLEVACFASGCLYRCSTCQNWQITYLSKAQPLSPLQAASQLTATRLHFDVDRLAISGGESILNRRWLLEFVTHLKKLNSDSKTRIHIDTNAAILTSDYIDDLVVAGMTDIGPDLKGFSIDTFMKITNIKDKELADKYLKTSWNAVKYTLENYKDEVFLGVGIPFNNTFMNLEELAEIGTVLAGWDPNIQVTVLDYRPEFRASFLKRPSLHEMRIVKDVLIGSGLTNVICQTLTGYIK
ncbi:MAG: radical SAM protein [Candidatus Hodarchaeota archaeon]